MALDDIYKNKSPRSIKAAYSKNKTVEIELKEIENELNDILSDNVATQRVEEIKEENESSKNVENDDDSDDSDSDNDSNDEDSEDDDEEEEADNPQDED